jgi:type II secretory pathway component PulM
MISQARDKLLEMLDNAGEHNRSRKILFAVAGILFLLVVFQFGWNRFTAMEQNLEEQIELKTVQLENQRRIVEQSESYRRTNQELKDLREEIVSTKLLQGDTPALAEAKLQNMVNSIAKDTQVNVLSMRMLPRKKENIFTILQIGINGRAEIDSIQDFLIQIEQEERFMYVSELEIKIVNRREERYFNFSAQITALAYV